MLKQLELQEEELLKSLATLREAITKEKLLLAEKEYGVRVGSFVVDRKGVEYKVTRVIVKYGGKPWLECNKKKKDGTFGTALRKLYNDWQLVIE